jgi:hypothetical protein
MFFLIALVIGILGAATVFISADAEKSLKVGAFVILGVIYTLLGWLGIYLILPSLAWPLFGTFGGILFVWWIISAIVSASLADTGITHAAWFPVVYFVVLIGFAFSGWGAFHADTYAGLIGQIEGKTQKHWSQDVEPLDPTHIRLVPKELAVALAKTTLSQDGVTLGSQFPLDEDHATLQKINNDYWYLIPLDYKGWRVWTNANCVPGYVRISATDPYAKPQLITGSKMKYTPGAYFGDNMERRLYSKYKSYILTDFSFEEDESGKLFWVVTACSKKVGFFGTIVDGVILFDPETGEDTFILQSKLEENPKYAWIDRVMPMELVKSYIDEWGNFKGGWWNQVWDHIDMLEAETPILNYSADGRCVVVTPITSTNNSDATMTGLMYTDARTGKSTYYAMSGGSSEQAVIDAVNAATSFKRWHASSQIVYDNIYGKLCALIPLLGENGNYQGLAIVQNDNKRVALGVTPQEALVNFQTMLMSSGGQITTESKKNTLEYKGKIIRLGWELSGSNAGKQYYLYFNGFKNSFIVSSSMQSELSLTREGDLVSITYIKTDQVSVPVMSFKNLTLNLQGSANEKAVIQNMVEKKEVNQKVADVKDFKEEVKTMSDEEIQKLMKK